MRIKEFTHVANYREVAKLIRENLAGQGYARRVIVTAEELWNDYICSLNVQVTNPKVWAAAIECLVARLVLSDPGSLAEVANRYGTSEFSVSRKYRKLCSNLRIYGKILKIKN